MNIVQKTSWKVTALASGAALVVGGLVGAGIVQATSDTSSCQAAIGHADQAMDIFTGAFGDVTNALRSYSINDYAGMDASTRNMENAADDLKPVLTDYYLTSGQCLGQ